MHEPISKNALLQRLNPLTKVVASVPVFVVVAMLTNPIALAALCLFLVIALVGLGHISPRMLFRRSLFLVFFVFTQFTYYPFVIKPELLANSPVVFHIGGLAVHRIGLWATGIICLRFVAMFLLCLLFFLTTEAADLIRALMQHIRFNHRLGLLVLAAYRFFPVLKEEFVRVREAHQIRGEQRTFFVLRMLRKPIRALVPVFVSALRKAERMALSLDARAFGAFPTRTFYRRLPFHPRDGIFLVVFWASLLLILVSTRYAAPSFLL